MSCVFGLGAEMILERDVLVQEVSCWSLGVLGRARVEGARAGGGLLVVGVAGAGGCRAGCGAAGAVAPLLRSPSLDSWHK